MRDLPRQHARGEFQQPCAGDDHRHDLSQDRLLALIGHDEYHFDSNAFTQSYAYLEEQRGAQFPLSKRMRSPAPGLLLGKCSRCRRIFTRTAIPSIYGSPASPMERSPTPSEVDPFDKVLIHTHALRSGRIVSSARSLISCACFQALDIAHFAQRRFARMGSI